MDYYLCPILTETMLSRLRRHHCSTSDVHVALKNALRTFGPEQARNTVASCSLNPDFPSSNSLSDSSTTSHSTLNTSTTQTFNLSLEAWVHRANCYISRMNTLGFCCATVNVNIFFFFDYNKVKTQSFSESNRFSATCWGRELGDPAWGGRWFCLECWQVYLHKEISEVNTEGHLFSFLITSHIFYFLTIFFVWLWSIFLGCQRGFVDDVNPKSHSLWQAKQLSVSLHTIQ